MPPLKSVAIAPGATTLTAILRPQFPSHIFGQHFDGPLHRTIRGAARHDDAGQTGRQIDDPSAVVDERQQLLGQEEHALEMNTVEGVQLRFRGLLDAVVVRDAGIVDEIVETLDPQVAERLAHAVHEIVEGTDVAGVELQGNGLLPRLGHQANDLFGFGMIGVVGKDRVDTAPGEAQHGVAAEAATATRYQSDFLDLRFFHFDFQSSDHLR
jgi:hypothetical protein